MGGNPNISTTPERLSQRCPDHLDLFFLHLLPRIPASIFLHGNWGSLLAFQGGNPTVLPDPFDKLKLDAGSVRKPAELTSSDCHGKAVALLRKQSSVAVHHSALD
jgi:hypothetical protein